MFYFKRETLESSSMRSRRSGEHGTYRRGVYLRDGRPNGSQAPRSVVPSRAPRPRFRRGGESGRH
jgi:hypothetical protein